MFFTLILKNENGDQADMIITATQYMTSEIDGLYPPNGTISTSIYADMNGSYLNNAFIEKRNFVITFQMRGVGIEKRRHELYNVVNSSRYIKVYYRTANIDVYTGVMLKRARSAISSSSQADKSASSVPTFTGIPSKHRLPNIRRF